MRAILGFTALALTVGGQAYAENFGNVLVAADQSTSCAQLAPPPGVFFGISVTSFKSSSNNTTSYWISFPSIVKGFVQPQYIVLRLDKTGNATSGSALVFNNSFLGGVISGAWSGNFSVDGFANFVINNVTYSASNGSCNLTLTNGLAIFAGG